MKNKTKNKKQKNQKNKQKKTLQKNQKSQQKNLIGFTSVFVHIVSTACISNHNRHKHIFFT